MHSDKSPIGVLSIILKTILHGTGSEVVTPLFVFARKVTLNAFNAILMGTSVIYIPFILRIILLTLTYW